MQQQFEQLKQNNSLQLEENMPVLWPKGREAVPFKVGNILRAFKDERAYAYNHKVIAFVYDGQLYVTPYTKESLEIIRNTAGFKLRELHIPFIRGEKPVGELGEKWDALIASAKSTAKPARKQAAHATTASLQYAVVAV